MKTTTGRGTVSADEAQSPVVEWTREDAEALLAALGPRAGKEDGPYRYCELAGFLFAVACAPELVKPSEWIGLALGQGPDAFGSRDQAQRLLDLVMRLYNHVNCQVLERTPSFPAGVEVLPEPMDNFASDAPVSQWARGFSAGHTWLEETWDDCLEREPAEDADALDEALGGIAMMLGFFASREFAEACIADLVEPRPLEQMAPQILEAMPEAMRELAEIGRERYEIELARRTPARSTKVGRNAPCRCGSGRKYKHCCGAASRSP